MTIEEFLTELANCKSQLPDWELSTRYPGRIRRKVHTQCLFECPICAVARIKFGEDSVPLGLDFRVAAFQLGLSSADAEELANAADGAAWCSAPLRDRMLKILGL